MTEAEAWGVVDCNRLTREEVWGIITADLACSGDFSGGLDDRPFGIFPTVWDAIMEVVRREGLESWEDLEPPDEPNPTPQYRGPSGELLF